VGIKHREGKEEKQVNEERGGKERKKERKKEKQKNYEI
jgi:hypothetical protein